MKLIEAMIAYTPGTDQIEVGIHPDKTGWTKNYVRTVGACFSDHRERTDIERMLMMFIDFNTIVVRDKVDAQVAHRAFLAIDEYRKLISPDMEGAEQPCQKT